MSDLLVRGMEMPENCWSCKMFCNCFACEGYACHCAALGEDIGKEDEVPRNKRRDDCPLVPVPAHGLIAREQILDAIRLELAQANACNDMDDYDAWMRIFDYVRKFPTVIPSEPCNNLSKPCKKEAQP